MKFIHAVTFGTFFALVSSCSTITPIPQGTPIDFLVATKDFVMPIPPLYFIKAEVMKSARIPVIGITKRDGKSYRVVVLPETNASGFGLLINEDGSFEGSAIALSTGARQGFSFRATPADVRLVAKVSAPVSTTSGITSEQEFDISAAIDAHLAATLKDPASAIQYSLGEATECRSVANVPQEMRDSWCVCYSVNAKNSMGGYTGARLGVVSLLSTKPPYLMLDVPKELVTRPQACRNVAPRDSALIHVLVK